MNTTDTIRFDCEYTDTFGGEANYSWVRRATLELPSDVSDLALVRKVKAALGLTGVPCRREDWGETIALYAFVFKPPVFTTKQNPPVSL